MIRKAHLKLIATHSVRHGIRGGAGLVSLFLTLALGLGLASLVISPLDAIDQTVERMEKRAGSDLSEADRIEARSRLNAEVVSFSSKAINWFIDPSEDQLEYLTEKKPAVVSAILMMLLLVTPLFSCLAGFNQTAGDVASKGLRFLLIRTERPNIYIGRFIGTFVFACLVNLGLFLILAVYMAAKVKVHPSGDMVLWLLEGYLRVMILTLPYIALCAWVSSSIDSPIGSLAISLMVTYLWPLLIYMGSRINESVTYGQFLTPWGYRYWLFAPPTSIKFFAGMGAMFGFTALFLWVGMNSFKKRDL